MSQHGLVNPRLSDAIDFAGRLAVVHGGEFYVYWYPDLGQDAYQVTPVRSKEHWLRAVVDKLQVQTHLPHWDELDYLRAWIHEDELPEGYPYNLHFQSSRLRSIGAGIGVRVFPKL